MDGGTAITVQGIGFRTNTSRHASHAVNAPVLAASANRLIATAPAKADGLQNIVLSDPVTGASSTMTNALTYGAGPDDTIKLIQGSNPQRRWAVRRTIRFAVRGAGAGRDDASGRGQRFLYLNPDVVVVGMPRRRQLHPAYR